MAARMKLPMQAIQEFCRRGKVQRMWLFGSVLRPDFCDDSDIDILVEFTATAQWNLLDLVDAEQELSEILGRPVGLIERKSVDASRNWIRRRHILENARQIYVAGCGHTTRYSGSGSPYSSVHERC